ncbi:ABC transporter permease [Mesorhizobium sp. Z1-4]|uniref:ABC transporter permease n=1 Tax=Mesorhizobium sp. Z1-4 TaxID=2448478 RepID=UPI000FDA94B3|nr:ABC transporter permease [Mesorhizobium sp. Z1-4]
MSDASAPQRSTGGALLAAPAFAILAVLFIVPMILLFVVSFWRVRNFALTPDMSLDAYTRVFVTYGDVLVSTMANGSVTALICVGLGFLFAYAARFRAGRWGDALILVAIITLFGGYLVKIYAWKAILSTDGFLNAILVATGVSAEPLDTLLYNRGAVIVALVHFLLPFAILPIYGQLRSVNDIQIEAAHDLGASGRQTLIRVIIPQCRIGLFAAFAISFLYAAGDYITPRFLGGGSGTMIGQFIAQEFSTRFNWPAGAAMSFVLMAASLLVLGLVGILFVRRKPS